MTAQIALALFSASLSGLLCFCLGWASRYAMATSERRPQQPIPRDVQPVTRQSAANIKLTTQHLKQQSAGAWA